MTNKKIIFVLALFLVLFVAVGAVSAADDTAVNGTFADLKSIIDNSTAGSTIILDKNYVYSDSDINLIGGISVNNALTIDGNGFTIDGSDVSRIFQVGNNIVLKNINFKNANQIGAGGAIYASGTISNFKLINCTFTNCNATGNGVVYLNKVTGFTLNNCKFINCNVIGHGGAIYIGTATNCNFNCSDFINCTCDPIYTAARNGGAIHISSATNCDFNNCTYTNCSAPRGGGGAINMNSATDCTLSDCDFTNCNSIGSTASGGAVNFDEAINTLTITKCSFTNCESTAAAGAVYITSAFKGSTDFTLNNCIFEDCNSKSGKAVYYSTNTKSTLTTDLTENFWNTNSDQFEESGLIVGDNTNKTPDNWVVIAFDDETSTVKFVLNNGSDLTGPMPDYEVNITVNYVNGTSETITRTIVDNKVTVDDIDFRSLTVSTKSGEELVSGQNPVYVSNSGNDENSGSYQHPVKTLAKALELIKDNGKIIFFGGETYILNNVNVNKAVTINSTDGTAVLSGNDANRILWISSNANISDLTFTKGIANGNGGAIYAEHDLVIDNCLFNENSATNGGAIYNLGSCNITGSNFIENVAYASNQGTQIYGGAIYTVSGSKLSVDDCKFVENCKDNFYDDDPLQIRGINGGAIASINAEVTIKNTLFESNLGRWGASCYFEGGNVKLINCNITNHKDYNGAVYIYAATAEITGCNFVKNEAKYIGSSGMIASGADIMIYGNSGKAVNINNCLFDQSSATSPVAAAGSVHVQSDGIANITDSTFKGISSTGDYGAIYILKKGKVSLDNVNFINCYSPKGGAITNNGSTLEVNNSKFIGNSGNDVGVIYACNGASNTIKNSVFENNTAKNGAIIVVESSNIVLDGDNFTNNTAKNGVVISANGKTDGVQLTIKNNEFIANKKPVLLTAKTLTPANLQSGNGVNAVVVSAVNSKVSGNTFKENDNKCIFHNREGATADFSGEANIVENNGQMKEGSLEGYIENDGTINGGATELINKYVAVTVDAEGIVTTKVGFAGRLVTQNGNVVINDNTVNKLALSYAGEGNNYMLDDTEVTDETKGAFASYSVKDQVFHPTADHPEPYVTTLSAEGSDDYKNDTGNIIVTNGTLKDLQDIINNLIPENGTLYIYGNYSYADEDSAIEINKNINIVSLNKNTITAGELDALFVVKNGVSFGLSDLTVAAKDNGTAIDMTGNTNNVVALNNVTFKGKNITVVNLGSASNLTVTNCTATDGIVESVDGATITGAKLVIAVKSTGAKYIITADATVGGLYIKGLKFNFTSDGAVIGAASDADNGTYYLNDVDFEPGTYVISADLDAEITNATVTKPVPPTPPSHNYKLTGEDVVKFVNGTECYTVTLTDNGMPVSNQIITLYLNNETFNATTDKNGKATFKLDLPVGNYTATAKWSYLTIKNTITVKELPHNYKLSADNVTKFVNGTECYIVTLTDNGKTVSNETIVISLNSETFNATTDKNGKATFKLDLPVGNYTVTAKWSNLTVKNTITVKPNPVSYELNAKDVTKYYGGPERYTVTLTDNSKPLAGETITITVIGKSYTRVTDENGTASLGINLSPGVYNITATWKNLTVKNTATVKTTINADDFTKYYLNGTQYEAYVTDSEGNSLDNVNITFNIVGVFYTRTAHNGVVKLNINLSPGEYIITAHNDVTGEQSSATVTVLPTLVGSDLNMTYKDGSKYECKLVDGQGKPVKGAELIFNIHGVFYHKITDDDGIARLNINLLPGEYIITAIYGSAMTSNIITVRDL